MNVSTHSQSVNYGLPKTMERSKPHQGETKQSPVSSQLNPVDTYTPSEKVKPIAYEKPTAQPDTMTIARLKAESDLHYQQLRDLIKQLLERQGYTLAEAQAGNVTVEVDEATQLKAQASISDGGEHSVEKVSDRLVSFAIAISSGDRSKLETLKGAIEEGFHSAREAFGGALPEISYQTLNATMEKLDKWAAEAA